MHDRLNHVGLGLIASAPFLEWLGAHGLSVVSAVCSVGGLVCVSLQTFIKVREYRDSRCRIHAAPRPVT